MLPVVHVSCRDLSEEANREDKVDDRKDNVVDHLLDLSFGGVPSLLNRSRDVTVSEASGRQRDYEKHGRYDREYYSCVFFH